ncbi:MAG: KpsF/GutQ family sugar-phosphate isomerase [Nitrospinales bacterium]
MEIDQYKSIVGTARRVLRTESDSISALIDRVDEAFVATVCLMDVCRGKVILTGIGKSGLIGMKISGTLSSLGIPSVFLHASEASHGDVGIIAKDDIIIAISNSGETEEILNILPTFIRLNCPLITLTGNMDSTLAEKSDHVIDVSVKEEACPLDLVPTASTTAALAMGDALAMALMEKKGFKAEEFARFHPGGSLGKKLLTTINDIMHTGKDIPIVREGSNIYEVISEMSGKRLGSCIVLNDNDHVAGFITDGDLRRLIETKKDISGTTARELMGKNPKTIGSDSMATKAVQIMEENSITCLIVSADGKSVDGIIHLHDLLKAGVV